MLYDVGALIWCFWGSLEGNDGMGSGREVQEEGDAHIPMADSCCYMVKTNTIP